MTKWLVSKTFFFSLRQSSRVSSGCFLCVDNKYKIFFLIFFRRKSKRFGPCQKSEETHRFEERRPYGQFDSRTEESQVCHQIDFAEMNIFLLLSWPTSTIVCCVKFGNRRFFHWPDHPIKKQKKNQKGQSFRQYILALPIIILLIHQLTCWRWFFVHLHKQFSLFISTKSSQIPKKTRNLFLSYETIVNLCAYYVCIG